MLTKRIGCAKMVLAVAVLAMVPIGFPAWAEDTTEGKAMTKSEICADLAVKTGLSKAQVATFFDELAKLAVHEAPRGFTVPELGKLVLVERAARIGRNPATGATIQIPAKKAVKFRIAKSMKDAILLGGSAPAISPTPAPPAALP